jgi:AraC-like DNA-binding protein
MQLASERDRRRVLQIVRENLHPPRRVFVGVIDPINPKVETPQEVRNRMLEASDFIPLASRPFGYRVGIITSTLRSQFGQISRVLRRIHKSCSSPINVEDLAREAYMSVSAFHHAFKAIFFHLL